MVKEYCCLRLERDVKKMLTQICPKDLNYSEFMKSLIQCYNTYGNLDNNGNKLDLSHRKIEHLKYDITAVMAQ